MNHKIVSYMVGRILQIEAILLLLPCLVSLIYAEWLSSLSLLASALIAFAIGWVCTRLLGKNDKMIFAKEGFAIVALAWIAMSLVGALPFGHGSMIRTLCSRGNERFQQSQRRRCVDQIRIVDQQRNPFLCRFIL